MKDNRLVCSGEKTKLVIIGTAEQKRKLQNKLEINFYGETVKESESEELVGLVINGELTWKHYLYGEKCRPKKEDNFTGLILKLSKRVGLLKQLRNKMNNKTFNMISNGIFTSLLIYGLPVFGNVWINNASDIKRSKAFTKEDSRRLQVLQNKILRLKIHANRYMSTKDLISKSGELSVNQTKSISYTTTNSQNYSDPTT